MGRTVLFVTILAALIPLAASPAPAEPTTPAIGASTVTIHAVVGSASGGAIDPAGDVPVNAGDSIRFTVTPDAGGYVADVLVDGLSVGPVAAFTFAAVAADHTIEARFTNVRPKAPFTLRVSAGPGGRVSPRGKVRIAPGAARTVKFTPAQHFQVASVVLDGLAVGTPSSLTLRDVRAAHDLAVVFAEMAKVALRIAVLGAGSVKAGTLVANCRADCQAEVYPGTPVTLTAKPDGGMRFIGWWVDGDFRDPRPLKFAPTADTEIMAVFASQ